MVEQPVTEQTTTSDITATAASIIPSTRGAIVEPKIFAEENDFKAVYGFQKPGPGSSGGMFGHYLELFRGGRSVDWRWAAFEGGIDTGNSWVANGLVPTEPLEVESVESEEDSGRDFQLIDTVEKNHVKIEVVKIRLVQIWVNVDDQRVIEVLRDVNNFGAFWTPVTAVPAARRYVEILQGWKHV